MSGRLRPAIPLMPSQNIEYLRDNGPAPKKDLPVEAKARHRADSVNIFRVTGTRGASTNREPLAPIYYHDEHDPEAVVRAFCDAHPAFVEGKSKRAFTRQVGNHGQTFREAARRIADDVGIEGEHHGGGRWEPGDAGECPLIESVPRLR